MRLLATAISTLLAVNPGPSAAAFRDTKIGDPVRNRRLPTIDGKAESLLGSAKANVFVFFRAGQDHSAEVLVQVAKLEGEFASKPVRFVGLVSSTEVKDDIRAMVKESGVRMPVLVDEGDALYGELGVYLHPSVGIADAQHRLAGYQPFRKINMLDAMRARIQLALGEIDEKQLAAVLDPPPTPVAVNRAHARLNLARRLLSMGSVAAAVDSARAGVAMDPNLGEGHAVLAEALARSGKCAEAERESAEARRLGATLPAALACAKP